MKTIKKYSANADVESLMLANATSIEANTKAELNARMKRFTSKGVAMKAYINTYVGGELTRSQSYTVNGSVWTKFDDIDYSKHLKAAAKRRIEFKKEIESVRWQDFFVADENGRPA